jgi:Phosphatidylinositol-glycan biosynthesis class S protein
MAGTRLLLQVMILVALFSVVLLSIHVGFCQQRLRPHYVGNRYPQVLVKEDYFQTDPILCPWQYIANNCKTGSYDNKKYQNAKSWGMTDFNSFSHPTKKLRYVLVLEDLSQLSTWATIVEKEWNFPSYLEQLETIQIEKPIQVHVVPRMDKLMAWTDTNPSSLTTTSFSMTNETLQEVWNHLTKHKVSGLDDNDIFVLLLYIPQMLETEVKQNEPVGLSNSTDVTPPPQIRSYHLELSSAGESLETNTWLLLPTTKDVRGHLGSYMDTWTVQAILDSSLSNDKDVATTFWNLLQNQWKHQALQLHQYISTLPAARKALDTLILPNSKKDLSMADFTGMQTAVSEWQKIYISLQALLLFHTGSTKTSPTLPPPLIQDFPLEHYAAIFMPLLFPLLVPFLASTIKEYKRWKEKKKNKGEKKGRNNNDEPKKEKDA